MQVKVVRLYVGTFFTSLDMQGASISLLPVESGRLARLDSPTQANATLPSLSSVLVCLLALSVAFPPPPSACLYHPLPSPLLSPPLPSPVSALPVLPLLYFPAPLFSPPPSLTPYLSILQSMPCLRHTRTSPELRLNHAQNLLWCRQGKPLLRRFTVL